jgi:hypothetical protein
MFQKSLAQVEKRCQLDILCVFNAVVQMHAQLSRQIFS